jgi:hypothetical protein
MSTTTFGASELKSFVVFNICDLRWTPAASSSEALSAAVQLFLRGISTGKSSYLRFSMAQSLLFLHFITVACRITSSKAYYQY